MKPRTGTVEFNGENVTGRTTSHRIGRGMAIVPENRRLFGPMTVLENLEMGAYLNRDGAGRKEDFEKVYTLFPLLYERRSQLAGTLSGGEQQMVAMGRALMSHPKLLLMDEPSMGLAPVLVERSFEIIQQVHEAGVAMLVVEQNANMALSIADRGYVLSTGRIVLQGKAADLLEDEDLRKAYLGRLAGRLGLAQAADRPDAEERAERERRRRTPRATSVGAPAMKPRPASSTRVSGLTTATPWIQPSSSDSGT